MPDTPHIKRFEEYEPELEHVTGEGFREVPGSREAAMLNDLAEHIEKLERWVENIATFKGVASTESDPTNPTKE